MPHMGVLLVLSGLGVVSVGSSDTAARRGAAACHNAVRYSSISHWVTVLCQEMNSSRLRSA